MKLFTSGRFAFAILIVAISLLGLAAGNPYCICKHLYSQETGGDEFHHMACFQSTNYMKDFEAAPTPVRGVTFSHSDIPILKNESFAKLGENLTVIGLDNVGLTDIESGAFKGLLSLNTLIIVNNKLGVVKGEPFTNLPNLKMVLLQNNQIHAIEGTFFSNLGALDLLVLNGNELSCLPKTEYQEFSVRAIGTKNNPWTAECLPWVTAKTAGRNDTLSESQIDILLISDRKNVSPMAGAFQELTLPASTDPVVDENQAGRVNEALTNDEIHSLEDLCNYLQNHGSLLYECEI